MAIQAQTSLSIPKSDQARLIRLAKLAGRTPQAMLRHALHDGLDYCEHVVKATIEGADSLDAGEGSYSTAAVMKRLKAATDLHAHKHKKAA